MSTDDDLVSDSSSSIYNLRRVSAPKLNGYLLLIFAKILRSRIGRWILNSLKNQNDFDSVNRLAQKDKLHDFLPLYYPLPPKEEGDSQYKKHMELAQKFDLKEFVNTTVENNSQDNDDDATEFRYWTMQDYLSKYQNQELTPYQVALAISKAVQDSNNETVGLKAIVVMNRDEVLQDALQSTERYKNNKPLGLLDGVPVAIKDEVDVKGYPTTKGTTFIGELDGIATTDCPIVAKLRQSGALIVGKTNMHEFGIGTTGYNWHFGSARNPHNLNHYTGGSSSGSAAAVAAGLVPLAVGLDGGGSIRIPSSLCGIVGLKPTFNRGDMDFGGCPSLAHIGPMASCVKDAAIGYAIMAGPLQDEQDGSGHIENQSQQTRQHLPPPHLASFSKNQDLKNVKIGIFDDYFNDADPEVVEACSKAVKHMESLGAQVIKVEIPNMEEIKMAHGITILTELTSGAGKHYAKSIHKFTPESQISFELGRSMDGCNFLNAQKVRRYAMHLLDENVFSKVDVFVTPGTACTAPPLLKNVKRCGESNLVQTSDLMRYIFIGNLCGIPGIAVPVGYSSAGNGKNLPISLLIQSKHWEEDIIFRLAKICEANISQNKPMVYYDIIGMASKESRDESYP